MKLSLVFAITLWVLAVALAALGQGPAPTHPLVILIGPPLSGKSTFVASMSKTYGMPAISIEDLIKDNAAELDKLRPQGTSLAEMRYDPSMSRFFQARVKTTDLSHGLLVDGYPATVLQGQDLAKMIPDLKLQPFVLQLEIPDDVVRARAKKSGRESDSPAIIEQRLKDYHREFDFASSFFPNARIVKVDANQSEDKTWQAIQSALDQAGIKP
jgi:adenylate kinase family enzyme